MLLKSTGWDLFRDLKCSCRWKGYLKAGKELWESGDQIGVG